MLGYIAVLAVLAAVVALAVRSLWKGRRSGGCTGDCAHCKGCH